MSYGHYNKSVYDRGRLEMHTRLSDSLQFVDMLTLIAAVMDTGSDAAQFNSCPTYVPCKEQVMYE
jgi:hypothetical protein